MNQWKRILFSLLLVLFFNEYIIYYITFGVCQWPQTDQTKVMIVADPHLLGIYRGHWFDKLRREWQMYRSFQTAVNMFDPQAVFFLGNSCVGYINCLGDIFDEGQWGPNSVFQSYVDRFHELFYVPEGVKVFYVPGNHDIGFHYSMNPHNVERFIHEFGLKRGVEYAEVGGNHFIMLNSMAMEQDGCSLCSQAEVEVDKLAGALHCAMVGNSTCETKLATPYSRPIVMQHFPLYRESDLTCDQTTPDLASPEVRSESFRPGWECLSQRATHELLTKLRPRAVFGGHVHFGCRRWWQAPYNLWEYTVSSFSWRNNRRPSFLLLSVSPLSLEVNYCFVPHEHIVLFIYATWTVSVLIQIVLWRRTRKASSCFSVRNAKIE